MSRLLRSAAAAAEMRDPAAALPREVAEIPLGMRRSLARGDDPNLLDRLLLDPDPVVIDHLLENPRITEDDVVRIAARRPIPASTLERIHASRRFATRPRVLFAMAGSVALVTAALAAFVSPWFLLLTAFAGVNQWAFAVVGVCPASLVLQRLGLRSCQGRPEAGR